MNLNSCEICRLNIKSSFNRYCCRRRLLNSFLQLGQRASACNFDHLFVCCLACVWGIVCRLSKHFSAVHSVVIVCAGDIRLLFKLLLKFRNVLKHTESRSSLTCNQNIKEDIPTALEIFPWFETKRHTCKQILHENFHAARKSFRRKNWVQCLKIT